MTVPPNLPILKPGPETDRRFMAAALALGRRNRGAAWPNPAVGALIVRFDEAGAHVVGRGATAIGGRPHAERVALDEAGAAARGATCYVTLEPCSHYGRTSPCTDALIEAGVARVVSALEDPDPRVAGTGHAKLKAAGIEVTVGVGAAQARLAHAGHTSRIVQGRPHVTLKLAVSADGFIGRKGEGQVAITGADARRATQIMRMEHDAILIGSGTALADDPLLTVRLEGLEHRSPVRVVLDSHARLPINSALVQSTDVAPLWVMVSDDASWRPRDALAAAGATILPVVHDAWGGLDLKRSLQMLSDKGITSVLVEGGATLAKALFAADLVDEAAIFTAPMTIGENGIPVLEGTSLDVALAANGLTAEHSVRLGADCLTWYRRGS
ncbi:MAG: bifunctional diaminohydroxyphosphoribosylaminopyrimidine deaminase/5-amino-6-(5-phosphoribosylamino)uracil reductase RibD [Hyphomicrobiales bacterium]|nr:MAG: bifunctional diaminohydroxyphosphoribosylaminopyrimidine deaminase/5-amino-6-(5-phosphoribosylamino)uracil reductase RibD [Hyphomicrobiales bacterium]